MWFKVYKKPSPQEAAEKHSSPAMCQSNAAKGNSLYKGLIGVCENEQHGAKIPSFSNQFSQTVEIKH